jgi:hypothetical protein
MVYTVGNKDSDRIQHPAPACSALPETFSPVVELSPKAAPSPFRLAKTVMPLALLAATFFLSLPAKAQVVNDPAQTMLLNNASRFSAVRPTELSQDSPASPVRKEPAKKAEKANVSGQPEKADPSEAFAEAAIDLKKDARPEKNKTSEKEALKTIPTNMQSEMELLTSLKKDDAPIAKVDDPLKAKAVMVDINSNTLNYDKDHDVYIATGSVHMVTSEQNSELYCDKLTYDQNQDLAIAEGNVVIIKDGQRTEGHYAKIDLTRRSALINDSATTISAVRVKAKQSFVNNNELILENGKMIISGIMYQQFMQAGGLGNLGQNTGKGAQQAKLRRDYSKKVYQNQTMMMSQLSYDQQQTYQNLQKYNLAKEDFSDAPDRVSRFSIKAKDIEIIRHQDGYDDITLKHPTLYAGKYKLFSFADTDFSYDKGAKQVQYLGPDIGSNRAYGGAYAGPGWDFHLGRGSLRFSPIATFGSPGFWSSDGKTGKQVSNGLGVGAALHFRDPDTTVDLTYSSHVGSPVFFADRRLFGDSTHFMASYNDVYQNGLLGQSERPTYMAQLTDYRVLKDFSKFQLTSFESLGYAKDNFYPNFRQTYFVTAKGGSSPQILGRAQLQFQLANTAPLLRFGKYASMGMRAQLLTAAYSSSDFIALGRIGPTFNLNTMGGRLQTSLGYTVSHAIGKSPFVFDSYYGGAQNVSLSNTLRINKFLSIGNSGSYSLNRDNAKKALAVGNMFYMFVGPEDLKATIGYDFVNSRSYFGFNFFPGPKNTVVNFDKMHIVQPANYTQPGIGSNF